jgi:hypothetical protein
MIAPWTLYPKNPECLILLFDLRCPEAVDALDRARVAWGEDGEVEDLDQHHRALVIYAGAAVRLL